MSAFISYTSQNVPFLATSMSKVIKNNCPTLWTGSHLVGSVKQNKLGYIDMTGIRILFDLETSSF